MYNFYSNYFYYFYYSCRLVPGHTRDVWLRKLRHTKIKFVFSACPSEAVSLLRGIYSFSEPELEPIDSHSIDEEEKLLENVHRDYEGPYHVLTPSFTTGMKRPVHRSDESKSSTSSSNIESCILLANDECVDIEKVTAVTSTSKTSSSDSTIAKPIILSSAKQVSGHGIRIIQVTEDDVSQIFYNISALPTRSMLKW